MKFIITVFLFLSVFSAAFYSCSNSTNPVGGGPAASYTITNNYRREINKGIPTVDTMAIQDNGSLMSLDFQLDTVLSIDGNQKLDVVLLHNNIKDTLLKQFTNPGFSNYSFRGCIFSDSASNFLTPGQAEYNFRYKPYSPLSVFSGQTLSGPWYLVFSYPALNKTGVIKSWSITITYNSPDPPPSDIHPLALGNYWTFAIDTGNISNVYSATLYVSDFLKVHGREVFRWHWSGTPYYWYLKAEADGLWWYGHFNGTYLDTFTYPTLWMKYPVNLNQSFISKQWIAAVDTLKCTGLDVNFYLMDGCVKYSETSTSASDDVRGADLFLNPFSKRGVNKTTTGDFYFKPGIGYSGNEFTVTTSTSVNFTRYRLVKYYVQ